MKSQLSTLWMFATRNYLYGDVVTLMIPAASRGRQNGRVSRPAPSDWTDQEWNKTLKGFGTLVERITPWLLELGSWIYGALIAFNLLILASLLTVGPVDRAVLVATAALALAIPPDVAGFVLLRLVDDLRKVRLEDLAIKSFEEAGFDVPDVQRPGDPEAVLRSRTRTVLLYCYSILTISLLLTLIGVTAALWHMAWWIGVSFFVMSLASVGLVVGAFATPSSRRPSQPPTRSQP